MEDAPLRVPFCDLAAVNREVRPQLDAAYNRVMARGEYILGEEVDAFEREWAAYCERKHAVGVGNATDAIALMLRACGIGAGDGVIVPGHTCVATWMGVSATGAVPIAVDVGTDGLIDPSLLSVHHVDPALGNAQAVLVVHLYGRPCDMLGLRRFTDRFGLKLLVDAAQGHGLKGEMLGDAAAFSFYPTKNLGALGDGGAVVTDDEHIASRVALLRNYGSITKNRNEVLGANSRLDELQAAFLRAKLPFLDRFNARRLKNSMAYGLAMPGSMHHQCTVMARNRDHFRQSLAERGVETMVHYPTPPHLQQAYADLGYGPGSFPMAERIAREIVSLPCGPELSAEQVETVVNALRGDEAWA